MTNRIHREIIGGHLLIIGGAEDKYNERRILRKFLSLAGDEKANILIIPVASDYPEFASDVYVQAFRKLGVANPRVLRATSRQEVVEADADALLENVCKHAHSILDLCYKAVESGQVCKFFEPKKM